MKIEINPKKFVTIMAWLVAFLVLASLAGQVYKYTIGHDRYLVNFFSLDKEWNLPTWFASTTLFFSALLFALVAQGKKQRREPYVRHWAFLAITFLFLAIDEAIQLHEQTVEPLRELFGAAGFLYFTWVVLAGAMLVFFGLAYLRFLFKMPPRFRNLFIIAAAIYVGGAIGMEVVGGRFAFASGQENLTYAILTNIEECLEMVGILVLIYALLTYITVQMQGLQLSGAASPSSEHKTHSDPTRMHEQRLLDQLS